MKRDKNGKVIISPLVSMLMELPLDTLIKFLERFDVQFGIMRKQQGHHEFRAFIHKDGLEQFIGHGRSFKRALAHTIAEFLLSTADKDFHDLSFGGGNQD